MHQQSFHQLIKHDRWSRLLTFLRLRGKRKKKKKEKKREMASLSPPYSIVHFLRQIKRHFCSWTRGHAVSHGPLKLFNQEGTWYCMICLFIAPGVGHCSQVKNNSCQLCSEHCKGPGILRQPVIKPLTFWSLTYYFKHAYQTDFKYTYWKQ